MLNRCSAIVAAVVLCGCGIPLYSNQNGNNGQAGRLSFDLLPVTLPLGVPVAIPIRHRDEGTFECKEGFKLDFSGSQITRTCRFLGTSHAVVSVDSAKCADEKCAATVAGTTVTLTPLAEGEAVLEVTATIDDGRSITDTFAVSAAKFDPVRVECSEASRCPGPHAVFAGATFGWRVQSMLPGQPSPYQRVELSEDSPTGVISLDPVRPGEVMVHALKPGLATLRIRDLSAGRDFTTTRQVRVVAIDSPVRGEVHLRADTRFEDGLVSADADPAGEVVSELDTEAQQLVLAWRLADGTLALGGARRVTSPDGMVIAPAREASSRAANDVEYSLLYFLGAPGPVRLSATLGSARLEASFENRFQRPAPPACAAPTTYTDDLTGLDDSVGQWDWWTSGSIEVLTSQPVDFDFSGFPLDVVLRQRCGPAWATPGPLSDDFTVTFSTPGQYAFEKVNGAGEVVGYPIEVLSVP